MHCSVASILRQKFMSFQKRQIRQLIFFLLFVMLSVGVVYSIASGQSHNNANMDNKPNCENIDSDGDIMTTPIPTTRDTDCILQTTIHSPSSFEGVSFPSGTDPTFIATIVNSNSE